MDEDWNDSAKEELGGVGAGVTFMELLNGLVQHHAYHSGQIALLSKF
ncbi:hypothetical protein [Pedobacter psychrotolerans]|uniref:DinB family protein n=1 Tax=Pedobacter psychrotolerans TaxID=1843235 RepID=A0ABQ1SW33_9SPHI|nr:hypothetical protein [Pedobacter psychrotolerans]GGE60601.1 hypothetical protein GCM10011413_28760 [Pedobacter psychrotolerans]